MVTRENGDELDREEDPRLLRSWPGFCLLMQSQAEVSLFPFFLGGGKANFRREETIQWKTDKTEITGEGNRV